MKTSLRPFEYIPLDTNVNSRISRRLTARALKVALDNMGFEKYSRLIAANVQKAKDIEKQKKDKKTVKRKESYFKIIYSTN
jgi:hypothetical protein